MDGETLCHACHNCITNEMRSRAHRDEAAPALSDMVRLTPMAPQEIKHEPLSDLRFRIIGLSPLLLHNCRLADPLEKQVKAMAQVTAKRKTTEADHHRLTELECQ